MADKNDKLPQQPDGKFYVDSQCIDCNLCRETAPDNFKRDDDNGYSYVYKQPLSPEEEKLCQEALEACPVEAIGSDGG
jgi:ferredoxin